MTIVSKLDCTKDVTESEIWLLCTMYVVMYNGGFHSPINSAINCLVLQYNSMNVFYRDTRILYSLSR